MPTERRWPGWRLESQGEQLYRLWRVGAERPAGVIVGGYNSWTARPFGAAGRRRAWETPTMREVVTLLIHYLEGAETMGELLDRQIDDLMARALATSAEAARLRAQIAVLRDVATGRRSHIYQGACPDTVDGPDRRDPECEVCQALGEDDRADRR